VQQVLSRESGDAPRLVLGLVRRVSGVESAASGAPGPVGRISVYPQPLAGTGIVQLTLAEDTPNVAVEVFDAGGRHVSTIYEGPGRRGEQTIAWRGDDSQGLRLAPGIYLVRAATGAANGRTGGIGSKVVLTN
jgi:flagellar hook assembly protein FlgD